MTSVRRATGAEIPELAGFARADADQLPCFLATETTADVAYYRHYGLPALRLTGTTAYRHYGLPVPRLRGSQRVDLRTDEGPGPHMWGMYRPRR